jgi:hypothetical protein
VHDNTHNNMKTQVLTFRLAEGWSAPMPSDLDSEQTLVLAFGSSSFAEHTAPFEALRSALPQSVILGCSTSGEIAGPHLSDASISVAVTRFDHTRLRRVETVVPEPEASAAAGAALAAQLAGADLRAVFILSEGLAVNGTSLVAGLVAALPPGVQVTGGLAGDGAAFAKTWVLAQGLPQTHRVSAVGLYGDRLHARSGCDGGWMDFGPLRRVTKSVGPVLHELDGKPALDLYKDYLGKLAADLPGSALLFPLSIRAPGSTERPLVRTILGIDEQARTMTFAGDMPEGHEARLMRATDDGLIGSAAQAMSQAAQHLPDASASLVISVSCVGRRLMLGERAEEEVETIAERAPAGGAHVGFYSYGEIAPAAAGGACVLHNQTMTVTVYAEV